jgi:hypothetical protein
MVAIEDRALRRSAKERLLNEVLVWLREDADRAKASLEQSAAEVIQRLRRMAAEII